jgi:ketosteroid isomerase-like protein
MDGDDYSARKAAARANRAFYQAIERCDLEAMRRVWLESDRARCVHPGWGLLTGYAQIIASWEAIFRSPETLRFEVSDLDVETAGKLARATNIERIHAVVEGTDRDTVLSGTDG